MEPRGATSPVALFAGLTYWTSFNTACWAWLACCRAAIPVDSRTLYWVMLATVVPMSAFCRLLTALCRLVTWSLITVVAALSRLTEAPIVPRWAETRVIAALIAVSAAWEVAELVRVLLFRFNAVAERALMLVVILVLVPEAVVPSPM